MKICNKINTIVKTNNKINNKSKWMHINAKLAGSAMWSDVAIVT